MTQSPTYPIHKQVRRPRIPLHSGVYKGVTMLGDWVQPHRPRLHAPRLHCGVVVHLGKYIGLHGGTVYCGSVVLCVATIIRITPLPGRQWYRDTSLFSKTWLRHPYTLSAIVTPCAHLMVPVSTVHVMYTGTTTLLYKPYCRVIGILCRSAGAQNNIFYCRLK